MNKRKRETFLNFLVVLIGFFLSFFPVFPIAHAKSVTIPSVDIVATIRQDGSVEIVEKRTIRFDGDFTYGFYELPKAGAGELTDFSIAEGIVPFTFDPTRSSYRYLLFRRFI